ncbi:MAG: bifunctional glutamate N-acetyltransferase/amino-acid acetyltransferase ArgJ [Eubacterium sp.]|nr:bifunctional glutamate N-acetyltransferase/amino-acid acetyltransferase ArgJ [Eubacterium sp.]
MSTNKTGVTLPDGFMAAAAEAGIKYQNRLDMAMIYSEVPCKVAGTFTTNQVKAAPVKWDQHIVYDCGTARAVICNSGIANAATGQEGMDCCRKSAEAAAKALNAANEAEAKVLNAANEAAVNSEEKTDTEKQGKSTPVTTDDILVASTGVIGMQIPVDKISAGVGMMIPKLSPTEESAHLAAQAIMTTDTVPKEVGIQVEIGGKTVSIGGMCKGSGMIHPNMCTMLSFLTTDAAISQEMLQKALSAVVVDTYNMVSVDGDTSTNDTVLLLANGMAGNAEITEENADYQAFCEALFEINRQLARKIASDGEGATALFEVKVKGAADKASAVTLAKSVVTSSLTKAAIYGHDANWGRIMCALGYAGIEFDPDQVELWLTSSAGTVKIFENGSAADYSEEEATKILSEPEVTAIADMHQGDGEATAWGCDLTHEYVSINADYRS